METQNQNQGKMNMIQNMNDNTDMYMLITYNCLYPINGRYRFAPKMHSFAPHLQTSLVVENFLITEQFIRL